MTLRINAQCLMETKHFFEAKPAQHPCASNEIFLRDHAGGKEIEQKYENNKLKIYISLQIILSAC